MKISFPEHHLFQFLRRFENQQLPIDLFLHYYFKAHRALGAKDRQLIAQAAYGMIRWKTLLDHLIGPSPTWEQRYTFFNHFQPANYLSVNTIPLHVRVSFPKELLSLLIDHYGQEKAISLCQTSNTQAPVTVRINPSKTTREKLLTHWQSSYEVTPCAQSPHGILFNKRIPLVALPEFKEGLFEIQDEASQIVASLIQCQPGQHVLDYCAGAGGKTLGFAHLLNNSGQIYLHDVRPVALEQAKKRLRRAGIQNCQFLTSPHSTLKKLVGKMDWVLVDAPCSGTGTLRRNPDQKWKFSLQLLGRLVEEQRIIFKEALKFLKPGGSIVYATCSILKAENEDQVDYFSKQHNLTIASPPFISLPSPGGMDGFFAIAFVPNLIACP